MINKSDALYEGLKKMLNYLPMIYNQQNTEKNGEIIIKYPYEKIPDNALLFVLPLYNSFEDDNYLVIKYAKVDSNGEVYYESGEPLHILIESTDGTKKPARSGDIVANRLCMFRFMSRNSKEVILINNPIYNHLKCTTLHIVQDATFCEIPKVLMKAGTNSEYETPLALNKDLQSLEERVTALENKFKVGTEPAEEYFDKNNSAKGTIYLQVEE